MPEIDASAFVTVPLGKVVVVFPDDGGELETFSSSEAIEITCVAIGGGTPPPQVLGPNMLPQGTFLVSGKPSLSGWTSEKGYWHLHRPLPWDPSGTGWGQADRDYDAAGLPLRTNKWPEGVQDDTLTGETVSGQPIYSAIVLRWLEEHHMKMGQVLKTVYGQKATGEWVVLRMIEGVRVPPTTKTQPPVPQYETIDLAGEQYVAYALEVWVELQVKEDGYLIGGIELRGLMDEETREAAGAAESEIEKPMEETESE